MAIPETMPEFFKPVYGKYYEALPDRQAYLARIGLADTEIPLTREGLDKVLWAHLSTVPFENIDLYDYDIRVDFGIPDLFDKIVLRRRGGYCFELNSLFMALLEELGFEVYAVGVRILMGGEGFMPAIAHRGSIVLIDGQRFFADVGFGMTSAAGGSICVDTDELQPVRDEVFSVEDRPYNHKIIFRHKDDGPKPEFTFIPDPFPLVDFVAYNTSTALSGWRARRIANLRTADGSISVDGDIFRRTTKGERIETACVTADDALKVLTEEFGMVLTEPLREIAINPEFRF